MADDSKGLRRINAPRAPVDAIPNDHLRLALALRSHVFVVEPVERRTVRVAERLRLVLIGDSVADDALEVIPYGRAFVVGIADVGAIGNRRRRSGDELGDGL